MGRSGFADLDRYNSPVWLLYYSCHNIPSDTQTGFAGRKPCFCGENAVFLGLAASTENHAVHLKSMLNLSKKWTSLRKTWVILSASSVLCSGMFTTRGCGGTNLSSSETGFFPESFTRRMASYSIHSAEPLTRPVTVSCDSNFTFVLLMRFYSNNSSTEKRLAGAFQLLGQLAPTDSTYHCHDTSYEAAQTPGMREPFLCVIG